MACIKSPKVRTIKANKSLVCEYRNMTSSPYERNISLLRMAFYRQVLARGEFWPCIWAKTLCKQNGKTYRVNGQHTSLLLYEFVQRGEEVPDFHVTLIDYECDTLDDVSKLYNTFDTKDASRSVSDINRAFAGFKEELNDVPGKIIDNCVSGINYHVHRDGMWAIKAVERAEVITKNVDFTLFVASIVLVPTKNSVRAKMTSALRRMAVVAAMYATWESTHENTSGNAREFWCLVREKEGANNCPARVLSEFLYDFKVSQTRDCRKGGSDYKRIYHTCRKAWNLWVKGRRVNNLKLKDCDMEGGFEEA